MAVSIPPRICSKITTEMRCADSDADGFFDAGMLQAALKANQEQKSRPSEKAVAKSKVGKKLQLMEF